MVSIPNPLDHIGENTKKKIVCGPLGIEVGIMICPVKYIASDSVSQEIHTLL